MNHISLLALLLAVATATTYFSDDFADGDWKSRWVTSEHRPAHERGTVTLSAGKYFINENEETGLKTSEDARFYTLSSEFEEFSNDGKTLVLQYSLKQDQEIDCGGGYLKLHPAGLKQKSYNGDSAYNIMFGPDVCGGTRRIHVIFNHKNENHLIKTDIPFNVDTYTHVYTLIVKPDNTFSVLVDNKLVREGDLEEDFGILPPKKINDPSVSKPSDWVDEEKIDDPNDVKPEGYDDIPAEIVDPEASKPEDWDDELDGEWEAPVIPNPAFKGPWKAKKISNPAYKGPWIHPQIDNPAFYSVPNLYSYPSHKFVGIEIWQVKSGSIFDNLLVTDDVSAAKVAAEKIIKRIDGEKASEAAKKAEASASDDDDDEKDDL